MELLRGYDKAGLDAQYNNSAKVENALEIVGGWMAKGEEARAHLSCDLDIQIGAHPRQSLDVFPAGRRDAPILIFIHGGYWHLRDKTMAHFLAPTYVAADVTLITAGYRLCPEVTISDIVEDIRLSVRWAHENARKIGGDPNRIYIAGHSAGGHLTAMMCSSAGEPGILKGGCSISGLHDLEPIRLCYLNEQLHLSADDVPRLSPTHLAETLPSGTSLPPLMATVGGDEGPEYLLQRDGLVSALRAQKQPVSVVELPGRDHFTAKDAFADHTHELCQSMLRMILSPSF